MELFLWSLNARDAFSYAWPVLALLLAFFAFSYIDFPILLVSYFFRMALGHRLPKPLTLDAGNAPHALIIIPSLLRNDDDFGAIVLTVESCARNRYPGPLLVVASVDGANESAAMVTKLREYFRAQNYPRNVAVAVGGTPGRLGKMMAVEAGVQLVQDLVADGRLEKFPSIYFSIDGDGELGPHALRRMVEALLTPHRLTRRPHRVIAGKCYIRPELFWQGFTFDSLKNFFTVKGQIYRQVSREFVVSNIPRFNLRPKPQICIPGGLYCTWSDLLLQAPKYMGFMRTIRFRDWVKWWLGFGPPQFSKSTAEPLPEALTGPSDDTCISFLAQMATWKDGKLSLDAPRTPLHALGRLCRSYLFERTPGYAPEARVLTYTPSTLNGLWVQRVRWNASRFECSYRFKNAFAFHWEVGVPVSFHWLQLSTFFQAAFFYVFLPYNLMGTVGAGQAFIIGYLTQMLVSTVAVSLALVLEKQRSQFWPVLLCLPVAPFYSVSINFFAGLVGISKDLFFYGNSTKFAPEWTLKKGGTVRIALLYRVRRFLALCVRAIRVGDVPFGSFWWGWRETKWTPNGYEGWTTGKSTVLVAPDVDFNARNNSHQGNVAPRASH